MFHPTRSKDPIFEHFLSFFEPLFCETHTTRDSLSPTAYYVIARKIRRQEIWGSLYNVNVDMKFPKFQCNRVSVEQVENRS